MARRMLLAAAGAGAAGAKNLIYVDSTGTITVLDGISNTILDSFAAPGSSINGVSFDGENLLTFLLNGRLLSKHSGVSSTILTTITYNDSGSFNAIAFDGVNVIQLDGESTTTIWYVHSGISSTVTDTLSSSANSIVEITFDGTNLISISDGNDRVEVHNGIFGGVNFSFATPDTTPSGVAWDGINIISSNKPSDKIFQHDGKTSTILTSFSSPGAGQVEEMTVIGVL